MPAAGVAAMIGWCADRSLVAIQESLLGVAPVEPGPEGEVRVLAAALLGARAAFAVGGGTYRFTTRQSQ